MIEEGILIGNESEMIPKETETKSRKEVTAPRTKERTQVCYRFLTAITNHCSYNSMEVLVVQSFYFLIGRVRLSDGSIGLDYKSNGTINPTFDCNFYG